MRTLSDPKNPAVLITELDKHIVDRLAQAAHIRAEIDKHRDDLTHLLEDVAGALRLYRSLSGSAHPSEADLPASQVAGGQSQPRLAQVIDVLARAGRPLSLQDVTSSLPDAPEPGTVSAALHRAIQKGAVRRVTRGIYEIERAEGGAQERDR